MTRHEDAKVSTIDAEEEMLREGSRVALKAAAIVVVVEAAAVFLGVRTVRDTMIASQELFKGGGGDWYNASMPAVLFALVGGGMGCLLGWRVVASSGLTGPAAMRIALVAWALVETVAIAAALLSFGTAVPIIFWVGFVALSVTGIVGILAFTVWMA